MRNLIKSIAGLVILGGLLFNPITVWVAVMWKTNLDWQEEGVEKIYETGYKDLCWYYAKQTTWERWTTLEGWESRRCDKYLDRM